MELIDMTDVLVDEPGSGLTPARSVPAGAAAQVCSYEEVLEAAEMLEEDFDIPADIWSVTSYKLLYEDARDTERTNRLQGIEYAGRVCTYRVLTHKIRHLAIVEPAGVR